jgi:tocopherol O-methyltransferase
MNWHREALFGSNRYSLASSPSAEDIGAVPTCSDGMVFPKTPQTVEAVSEHYDELDRPYREVWGQHLHHGYWRSGAETPAEATEALIELVSDKLHLTPGMAVCDIGCGYGATAEYLAIRHDVAVTGVTISQAQANFGRERRPARGSITCVHKNWLTNGFPNRSFDAAYAIESSEHMPDKQLFFSEAWRTLQPGGTLVVCSWLACSAPRPLQVRHLLEPICREGRLPSLGSREGYERLATAAGFTAESFEDIGPNVSRTWSICAWRVARKLVTDGDFLRLVVSSKTKNRSFLLTIPRMMVALKSGALRYGLFVWRKSLF